MPRKLTVTINEVTHIVLESDIMLVGYQRHGVPAHYEKGHDRESEFLWGGDNPLMCKLFHVFAKLGAVVYMDFKDNLAVITVEDESYTAEVLQITKDVVQEVWGADTLIEE